MLSSVEKLQKFVKLEVERGYDNRAVVGGLDKILPAWEQEARANHLDEDVIQAVIAGLKEYPNLEPAQRAESLSQLLNQLEQRAHAMRASAANAAPLAPRREPAARAEHEQPNNLPQQAEENRRGTNRPQQSAAPTSSQPGGQAQPGGQSRRGQVRVFTPPSPSGEGLDASVKVLQGVGTKLTQTLSTLGLNTLEDLLYYFPRRYDDYSQLKPINRLVYGEETTVLGTIQSIVTRPIRGGKMQMTEAAVTDGTGTLRVSWFNKPWLASKFTSGTQVVLAGRVEQYLGRTVMNNPDVEPIEQDHLHTNRIVPVYSLTAGLNQKSLRRLMFQTVSYWAPRVSDYLPARVRSAVKLIDLSTALLNIHFPESQDMLDVARWRLAFDEIFLLQLGVLGQKRSWQALPAERFDTPQEWLNEQTQRLPFQLTGAQRRVIGEIRTDLYSGRPMDRLVQGDVGSGKTAVAAIAVAMVTRGGGQTAVMAPTSILAEQHYRSFTRLLTKPVKPTPAPVEDVPAPTPRPSLPEDTPPTGEFSNQALLNDFRTANRLSGDDLYDDDDDDDEVEDLTEDYLTDDYTPDLNSPEGELPEADMSGDDISEEERRGNEMVKKILAGEGLNIEPAAAEKPDEEPEPQAELPVEEVFDEDQPEGPLRPEEIRLLIGDTSEAERQVIHAGLQDGTIKLLIGTHALIESPVQFKHLQLAVVDEQHRFGVKQRAALRAKGNNPHLLLMTATPIPRSLALTVYGDLDVSVMDEMPAGRQPVGTYVLRPVERERAYNLIRSQLVKGRQAFVVYPLVEKNDSDDDEGLNPITPDLPQLSAVEEHQRLQKIIFPKRRVGLLHGRMKPEDKDQVMRAFRDREYDILVTTTVIEVGVDVPNATVMLVEGANRFGLAQLHQLRGRVGRSAEQSFCLLIPDHEDAVENERLAVMSETNDGFVLAERDLAQRGPGDFLGTRQAGFNELKMANLTDVRLIEKARQQAQAIFQNDPDLSAPEYQPLVKKLEQFWEDGRGDIS